MENKRQTDEIIPEWLYKEEQEPINKKKIHNAKTLKPIAKENIKINHRKLEKALTEKMINP